MIVITTPALRAAERVREQCRVTEHRRPDTREPSRIVLYGRPSPELAEQNRRRIKRLREGGMKINRIAIEVGISETAVKRHLQAIRGVKLREGRPRTPIEIDGVRYSGVRAAGIELGKSYRTIYNWLREGKARHV